MKKLFYIFGSLIVVFSIIYLNKIAENYILSDQFESQIEMSDCNMYFYDNNQGLKNGLFFEFYSDRCNISNNFHDFSASDNINGKLYLKKSSFDFNCSNVSMDYRNQLIGVNDLEAKLNKDTFIKTKNCSIELKEKIIKSNSKIYYNNKTFSGSAENCYVDLVGEIINLKKSELLFDLDKKTDFFVLN